MYFLITSLHSFQIFVFGLCTPKQLNSLHVDAMRLFRSCVYIIDRRIARPQVISLVFTSDVTAVSHLERWCAIFKCFFVVSRKTAHITNAKVGPKVKYAIKIKLGC